MMNHPDIISPRQSHCYEIGNAASDGGSIVAISQFSADDIVLRLASIFSSQAGPAEGLTTADLVGGENAS
jgi:hypothetical protein